MDESEEILPEDSSIFADISNRPDNVSSDALQEESFSEFVPASSNERPVTSTPCGKNKRKPTSKNRPVTPPNKSRSERPDSPASRTRSATRSNSPCPSSPACRTRSATRSGSPCPSSPASRTRSTTRSGSPCPSSPASRTRSTTRSGSPSSTARRTTSTIPCPPPASVQSQSSKKSAAPGNVTGKFKCPKCPSVLANKKNLDVHLRGHLMTGVTSKAPKHEDIRQEMPKLLNTVLSDLIAEPVIGELSLLCHDYCAALQKCIIKDVTGEANEVCDYLSDKLWDIMTQKKALFPSCIKSTMYKGANKLLNSSDFLKTVRGHFEVLCESEESVVNVTVGNVVFFLTRKIAVFAVQTMRGIPGTGYVSRKKRSSDNIDNSDFRELVYHIGGSIAHGFLWKGDQYSKSSQTWLSFCEVLRKKFIRNREKTNECSENIRKHTDKQDRGGLKHISNAAFEFFLVLFDYLMSLEADDGTLPDNVMDKSIPPRNKRSVA